jgi:CelD/BcsL family acetyltransferase involved in cellulose biosynthesis
VHSALLELADIDAQGIGRWEELAASAIEPNPFFEPGFVRPAVEALEAAPRLLVAIDDSGEWAGAMPVVEERGWRRMPIRGFAAWRHPYSYFGAPLLRAGREGAALRSWLGSSETPLRPYLGLDLLDANGPVLAALAEAAADAGSKTVEFERHERAALRRNASGTLTLNTSAKRRRETARLGRRLGEEIGGEMQTVDRAGDCGAVEDFLVLEASGWKGAESTAFARVPGHAYLFRRLCAEFHAQGRLQLLSLQGGGRAAAMKCNLLAGDTAFCFKIAFDEQLAEFSPGVQLERSMVDYVSDDDRFDLIDTCAEPNNAMANRVWPDRRSMISLAISSPDFAGSISGQMVRGLATTRNMIRRSP